MVDVGRTPDRERLFDFNKDPVLQSWNEIFVRQGVDAEDFEGLGGLSVGVLRGSVQEQLFHAEAARFGVTSRVVPFASYEDAFAAAPQIRVTSAACPSFVDFVERGVTSGRQLLGLAQSYLDPLLAAGVDTVVLGCTHYPLLTGVISLVMGEEVTLVSSAEETAKDVYRLLTRADLLRDEEGPPPGHVFLATGDPEPFARLGRRFLGPEVGSVLHARTVGAA
jgi:glutamate racemase